MASPTSMTISQALHRLWKNVTSVGSDLLVRSIDEADPQNQEFRRLHNELRGLSGQVQVLESLAINFEDGGQKIDRSPHQDTLPFLDSCTTAVEYLRQYAQTEGENSLGQMKDALESLRATAIRILALTSNLAELHGHLSKPPTVATAAFESQLMTKKHLSFNDPDVDTIHQWMTELNSATNDRAPLEYFHERQMVKSRRLFRPIYAIAAMRWPKHAKDHWEAMQQSIEQLLTIPCTNNFIQWAMEYARMTFPDEFGFESESTNEIIDLSEDLWLGTLTPLHFAAMLGLTELCKSLIKRGASVNVVGRFGSPLFCALLGPEVLKPLIRSPLSWSQLIACMNPAGVDTIKTLLDGGARCDFRFHWKDRNGTDSVSLSGLAFAASTLLLDDYVFHFVVGHGARLGRDFSLMLRSSPELFTGTSGKRRCQIQKLANVALDYTIYMRNNKAPWERKSSPINAILDFMTENRLEFEFGVSKKLPFLRDQDFPQLIRQCILEEQVMYFRRLMADPRFDPNLNADAKGYDGTIIHLAVSGGHRSIMECLKDNESVDFSARDMEGRTPLMVVESSSMLDFLVREFNVSTSAIDRDGRNIWHLAAATNATDLMEWLCFNDPEKDENINVVSFAGRTPLIEALEYIEELRFSIYLPKLSASGPAVAHMILLQDDVDCTAGFRDIPLAHYAIQWGDISLVNKLLARGVNFRTLDHDGRTVLHHLNASADADFVRALVEHCKGLPLFSEEGLTPLETILLNSFFQPPDDYFELSGHPSCRQAISEEVFNILITDDVLHARNSAGECCWVRYANAMKRMSSRFHYDYPDLPLPRQVEDSVLTGMYCLHAKGALQTYEVETNKPAIWCFTFDEAGESNGWSFKTNPFLPRVFSLSGAAQLMRFYDTTEASFLMLEAIQCHNVDFVTVLVGLLPLHRTVPGLASFSLLEWAVFLDNHHVNCWREILRRAPIDQLKANSERIFSVLSRTTHSKKEKLLLLLERGLNPNTLFVIYPYSTKRTLLALIVGEEDVSDIERILLDNGADPGVGVDENAITALLRHHHHDTERLSMHIDKLDPQFDWSQLMPFTPDIDSKKCYILDLAISEHDHGALELLLERTNIRTTIDSASPFNQGSSVHLATEEACQECLKILANYGADFSVVDADGQTALHVAAEANIHEVFEVLAIHVPLNMKNHDGRTAMELAEEHGDERTKQFFQDIGR